MKTFLSIVLISSVFWASDNRINDPGFELYSKGYLNIINEEWKSSIQVFQELVDKFPQSSYADDATFWMGYSHKELGNFIQAFDKYFILINKYPKSNLYEKGISERIDIAKKLAENGNQRFVTFLKSGGDITNQLIQKFNKLNLFKTRVFDLEYQKDQLVAMMNVIEMRSRTRQGLSMRVKTFKNIDDRFNSDPNNPDNVVQEALTTYYKIQAMEGEIEYHDKIAKRTKDEIDKIIARFDPYLSDENIEVIAKRFSEINREFNEAYTFIEQKNWTEARNKFKAFLIKYPDHNLVQYSEYWLAYACKENKDFATAFDIFGNLIDKSSDIYINEESKYNRIMIASTLAREGNAQFVKFLEDGSDYKEELYKVFSELIKISDEKTRKELNRLFTVNNDDLAEIINTAQSSDITLNAEYSQNLVSRLNEVAEKVKAYYGSYKINLVNIVK